MPVPLPTHPVDYDPFKKSTCLHVINFGVLSPACLEQHLSALGRLEDAEHHFRAAVALRPDKGYLVSSVVLGEGLSGVLGGLSDGLSGVLGGLRDVLCVGLSGILGDGSRGAEKIAERLYWGGSRRPITTSARLLPSALTRGILGRGLSGNVQRFRGGLVFKAYRLLYHSTLGLRVIQKKRRLGGIWGEGSRGAEKQRFRAAAALRPDTGYLGFRVTWYLG